MVGVTGVRVQGIGFRGSGFGVTGGSMDSTIPKDSFVKEYMPQLPIRPQIMCYIPEIIIAGCGVSGLCAFDPRRKL